MTSVFSYRLGSLAAAAMAAMPTAAWAQASQYGYPYGPRMMDWGGGWYGMFLGPLFMILVIVAVVVGVVLLVRWLGGPGYGPQPPTHVLPGRIPLDILKERFARGDIDQAEYEARRRVLDQ